MKPYHLRAEAKVTVLALVAACFGWMIGRDKSMMPPQEKLASVNHAGVEGRPIKIASAELPSVKQGAKPGDRDNEVSEQKKDADVLPMNSHLRELGKRMAQGMLKPSMLRATEKQQRDNLDSKYYPFLASLGLTEEQSVQLLDLILKRNMEVIKARAEFRGQGSNSRAGLRANLEEQTKIRGQYDEQIASLMGNSDSYKQFQNFEAGRQYDEQVRLFEQQNGVQFSPEIQTKLAGALLAARQAGYNVPNGASAAAVDATATRVIQQELEGVVSSDLILKFSSLAMQPQVRQR